MSSFYIGLGGLIGEFVMQWNLCGIMLVIYTLSISVSGLLVHFSKEIPVPDFFLQAFKFGKMAHDSRPLKIISLMEVPKRWFFHFYITASVIVTAAGLQMWNVYYGRENSPSPLIAASLDILTTPDRRSSVGATEAAIGLILLALHIYRRLYENLFVSVFSSSYINILHYIVGHTHYIGAVALLLAEAPGFDSKDFVADISSIEIRHVVGVLVYLFGFVVQHQSLRILAGLRKHAQKDLQNEHKMPVGGMFDIVSCPHMFAEVLVYVGILIVLQTHTGWLLVTSWVISNQIQVAMMNHTWYKEKFKDYPKHRRAIFPFLL